MLYAGDEVLFSAGAVVFDDSREKILTVVCMDEERGEEIVMFPKGRIEEGESPTTAACREVEEEAGVICRIQASEELMGLEVRYSETIKKTKVIYWYAATFVKATSQRLEGHEEFTIRWIGANEASNALSFENDRKLFETCMRKTNTQLAEQSGGDLQSPQT
ncbi:putative mutator protein MutT4, partial [Coemansia erecta]